MRLSRGSQWPDDDARLVALVAAMGARPVDHHDFTLFGAITLSDLRVVGAMLPHGLLHEPFRYRALLPAKWANVCVLGVGGAAEAHPHPL